MNQKRLSHGVFVGAHPIPLPLLLQPDTHVGVIHQLHTQKRGTRVHLANELRAAVDVNAPRTRRTTHSPATRTPTAHQGTPTYATPSHRRCTRTQKNEREGYA